MNRYSTTIKETRKLKGYSQEYVAERLSISQSAYAKVESGETRLDFERLVKLSEILEKDILDLTGLEGFNCVQIRNNVAANYINENHNQIPDDFIKLQEQRLTILNSLIDLLREEIKDLREERAVFLELLKKQQ
jgi:transcriptional regulator with XRE-family HTH domain